MRSRFHKLTQIALVVLASGVWHPTPAAAQDWPHWRFDSGNSALNHLENFLFSPPDLFWFSAGFTGTGLPTFRSEAQSPVVLDLGNDPLNPGLLDPMIFVARRDQLYAYRPDLSASFASGSIQPVQGWPVRYTDGDIQIPPVVATVTQATRDQGTVTRRMIYVVTGTPGGNSFSTLRALTLDPTNPTTQAPIEVWTKRITGAIGGPTRVAGMAFADIGSDSTGEAGDRSLFLQRWTWNSGIEGWQGTANGPQSTSQRSTAQDAPQEPGGRGSWELGSQATNGTRVVSTEVRFIPEQLGVSSAVLAADFTFAKRVIETQNLAPGSNFRWELSTNDGVSYSELYREDIVAGLDVQWVSRSAGTFNFGTAQDHQTNWRLRLTATLVTGNAGPTNVQIFFDFPSLNFQLIGSRSAQQQLPLLFLTTSDGQVQAIHAQPFDLPGDRGGVRTRAGETRWTWRPTGVRPAFLAGPAVARVPLDGYDTTQSINGTSVANEIVAKNREWMVYAANERGQVVALEAFGQANSAGVITGNGKVRWTHALPSTTGGADAVLTPPLVWNGASGFTDRDGRFLTRLVGFDDMVVVGTRSGRLFSLDAQGDFVITGGGPPGASLGDPLGTTHLRWRYPDAATGTGDTPPWTTGGEPINSPIAAWNGIGQTTGVDNENTTLNVVHEDDLIYARYNEFLGRVTNTADAPFRFLERVGSVRAYGFIETADPIETSATVRVFAADGTEMPRSLFEVRSQFLDTSADRPDTDRDGIPDGSIPHGRITLLRQRWIDASGQSHLIQFGDTIRVTYTALGGALRNESMPFPGRRRLESEGGTAGAPIRASFGFVSGALQEPASGTRRGEELQIPSAQVDEFRNEPAPAMAVANNTIWLGSRYRGRFVEMDAEFLRVIAFQRKSGDIPEQGDPLDAQDANPDPVGAPAIAQGWLYFTYDSGLLVAFANEAPGSGSGPIPGGSGPDIVTGRPRANSIDKPIVRVTDAEGNPVTDEENLLFDWGETIYIKVTNVGGENEEGFFGNLARSPIRATLRGPMGDLPPVTVTPVRLAADSPAREAVLEVVVPNATSSNPMTPGTKLLKETMLAERVREPHWELRVEQIGVGWRGGVDPNTGRVFPDGPWEPQRDVEPGGWTPDSNTAPWISLNNPIAIVYNPYEPDLATPDNDANIAFVPRFSAGIGASRKVERMNGDPYRNASVNNFNTPTVLTVGTDPQNGRQLVFGDHGKATPGIVIGISDRSDLGVTGGRGALRVRVAGAKLQKLGSAAQISGGRAGSINQNERFPDDGPDGFYPSITGDRLQVIKRGDGSNATVASVNLLGALTEKEGPDAKPRLDPATGRPVKRLQVDPFIVSVDIPRYQADDVYATRARVPNPSTGVFSPDTSINPATTPYLDYVGPGSAPPNLSPQQRDDAPARVTVFVDANNNGRLDLQGNYREAYRTFAVQVVVRPDFRLEVRDRTVDLGRVWHGFETPPLEALGGLPPDGQAFYSGYWKRFTLVNTGNVNLPAIKPEVVMSFQGQPTRMVTLPAGGVDPYRALTLVRDPTEPGADLVDPMNIFLRTSFDDLLKPGSQSYNRGPGAWLQKTRVGAASPSAALFGGDPSLPATTARDPQLALQIPTGTPLGSYVGQVRFYNDQLVQAVPDTTSAVGYSLVPVGEAGNGLLDRVGNTTIGFRTEPFTDPTFDLRVKVTENLALGSVAGPGAGGPVSGRLASRTSPVAGVDSLNRRIALFYASNLSGLQSGRALQYDLFGTSLPFDSNHNLYPFDQLPFDGSPWNAPLLISPPSDSAAQPPKNTKPGFAQDGEGRGFVFWSQQVSPAPGKTENRLLYRQVTPNTGDPQLFAPGGNLSPLSPRSGPAPVIVPTKPEGSDAVTNAWYLLWHGGSAQKSNLYFSRSADPGTPSSWTAEAVLPTSPSLATVTDPSPSYAPDTGTLWVLYTGLSQRLGKTDAYVTKYDPQAFGDRRRFFGQLSFAPVTADVLRPNAARTMYLASGIDWIVDARNPVQVYLEGVPLLRRGDVGRANTSGELVFEVDRGQWPALAEQGARVVVDRASGAVRFSIDTRRMRNLMNLPAPPGLPQGAVLPDPEISADYTPSTLRLTRSEQSATSAVGFVTHTFEPSWYRGLFDGQQRPIACNADRLWVVWRRAAGVAGGGPTLYYKAFRPGVRVRRGGFRNLQSIRVVSRPDLVTGATGASQTIPIEDVDPEDGTLFFREEFEGLARVHGVPTPVEVVYLDPRSNAELREIHFINWREESGETPVPMDLAVNEGTVTAFPLYEQARMVDPASGNVRQFAKLQKIWLFWSSTRGTGSDIFQATIAPRFGPDAAPPAPASASTSSAGRRPATPPATIRSRAGARPNTGTLPARSFRR
jgi:hypothetical protein